MKKHLLKITLLITLIAFAIFYPFLPGEYDNSATTLSFMAQLLCFASLVLVPLGIVWLIYELLKYRNKQYKTTNGTYYFALIAFVLLFIIAIGVSISVFVSNNRSIGGITIVLFLYFSVRLVSKIKALKKAASKSFNPVPFYLICIPLTVLLVRNAFIDKAAEFSRNTAIQNSEQLIKDIETYYQNNGHYPLSMLSLHKDYKTSVIGIKQYHYEPNGKSYNLYFQQVSSNMATQEIVMYNKLDKHQMTSHDEDLLLLSPNELNQQRGYLAIKSLPNKHWKYFLFD